MSDAFYPRDLNWHPAPYSPNYKSTALRSPRKPLLAFPNTLTEKSGPVFGHDLIGESDNDLVHNYAKAGESAIGPRIMVHGQILDENARPVPNALIEVWQANAGGRYRHKNDGYLAALDPNFAGCGRTMSDAEGRYSFFTVKPAAYPWPNSENAWRPEHIHFSLFGSGFAQRLITQMYFEGDPLIALCPIVQSLNDPKAVEQLVAKLDMSAAHTMDRLAYRFDIILRGRNSTMFENKPEGN